MMYQPHFFFETSPSHDADDFIVSDTNSDAVSAIQSIDPFMGRGLIIYGEKGCGKTHLMKIFSRQHGAVFSHLKSLPKSLNHPIIIEDVDLYFKAHYASQPSDIFDIDSTSVSVDEKNLFHLYNQMLEQQGVIILTARTSPSVWELRLPDLRSRIMAMPAIRIDAPDEQLLRMLIVKLAADRQIQFNPGLINYILQHANHSYDFIEKLIAMVDEKKERLTKKLVDDVIQNLLP